MKIKVKPREAFILYQALNARLSTLKVAEKNNKKLATQVQTTLALRDRLFPAPVVIPNEEEA
jgi:hypothetical protein